VSDDKLDELRKAQAFSCVCKMGPNDQPCCSHFSAEEMVERRSQMQEMSPGN